MSDRPGVIALCPTAAERGLERLGKQGLALRWREVPLWGEGDREEESGARSRALFLPALESSTAEGHRPQAGMPPLTLPSPVTLGV